MNSGYKSIMKNKREDRNKDRFTNTSTIKIISKGKDKKTESKDKPIKKSYTQWL